MRAHLVSLLVVSVGWLMGTAPASAEPPLPTSKEATFVEMVSSAEVMLHATGVGEWYKGDGKKGDRDSYLLEEALIDARKCAVWFVLYGGTDPLLSADDAQQAFIPMQAEFFDNDRVRGFIAWEGEALLKRTKRTIEKNKHYQLRVTKAFRVNKGAIRKELEEKGVLVGRAELTDALGMPNIMVIPKADPGQSPIALMAENPLFSHGAMVIESYLTARRFDVIVPQQSVSLAKLGAATRSMEDVEEDYAYQLALSIGSDIYFTFDVAIESGKYGTRKAIVNVRAYETTTGRLLGTETGYSDASPSPEQVLVEQAINDAADNVTSRVMAYWKEDLERGVQYKLLVSISSDFDEDQSEEISFVFGDLLDEVTKNKTYKENVVTNSTLDYLLWADPERYSKSSRLYRDIKKKFGREFEDGVLKKLTLNRKFIQLEIVEE